MDYLAIGLNGFSYCVQMFAGAFCFFMFLQKRKRFYLRVGISFGILLIFSLAAYPFFSDVNNGYNWIWYVSIHIWCILLSRFCCEIDFCEAILTASCGSLLQHAVSCLFIFISYKGMMPDFFSVKYWVLYIVVYFFIAFFIARKMPDHGHYHAGWANAFVMLGTVITIVLVLCVVGKSVTIDAIEVGVTNVKVVKLFRLNQIYAVGACILVLALQAILQRELRVQKDLSENKNLWKQRQMQYEISRENIALITQKCHDMKYQIAALIQMDGYDKKRNLFIKDIQNMIEIYDNDVQTGNEVLDTILMEKGLYCKMHNIEWTCVADGKLLEFLDVIDLFAIMGNALDNAVEGVEKCKEDQYKSIGVRVWKKDLFAVVQVENSFVGELKWKDGLPLTSKKDKENHGIGIRSIKEIVEKYEGTLNIRVQDGSFILTILFPIPETGE